jgi:hypothetical protein
MSNSGEWQHELAERKSFIADLKADRATQKEKQAREAWTKYTAAKMILAWLS